MAVIRDFNSASAGLKVGSKLGAAREALWSIDSLGQYHLSEFTGLLTTIAANGEIFQMRWTDTDNLFILRYLAVRYAVITGFTAAQELGFKATRVTSWSVDGSGGTTITPSTTNLNNRSSYPKSKVAGMRISTTGALTAGTKTISTNPFLTGVRKTLAAAATVQDADFESAFNSAHGNIAPMIFAANEGFVVQNQILMGAAGTVRATVTMLWEEILGTDYPTL